ncbi:MAG: hypothetical protein ACOWWO_12010 [Peptococcaceae bacterium]
MSFAVLLFLVAIVGCGDNNINDGAIKETPVLVDVQQEQTFNVEEKTIDEPKYFNYTINELHDFIDRGLVAAGLDSIQSGGIDEKNTDEYGKVNCHTYYFATGGFLFLYEDEDKGRVMKIALSADIDMLDEKGIDEYSMCLGLIMGVVDPNDGERIRNELDLNNLTKANLTFATGENGDYIYRVQGDNVLLIIDPA